MMKGWSAMGFLYPLLTAYKGWKPSRVIIPFSHQGCDIEEIAGGTQGNIKEIAGGTRGDIKEIAGGTRGPPVGWMLGFSRLQKVRWMPGEGRYKHAPYGH